MKQIACYLLWPGLLGTALVLTGWGMTTGHEILFFNLIYLGFALVVGVLERLMPYEKSWLEADGQTLVNLAHTVLNKGVIMVLVVVSGTFGLAAATAPHNGIIAGLWPQSWPLFAQVLLGLTIAEFGLYWAHRLAHIWGWLWRFHAVHHSVTRLWFINTGRFHFIDTAFSVLLSQPLLYLAGAPVEIFLWISVVTAFIGILTHCNIEMRFGPINYLLNTPGLHRWHHSMDAREGNSNFGENLMIWDLVFQTFFNSKRRPPARIGINGPMPSDFIGQLVQPFTSRGTQTLSGQAPLPKGNRSHTD